MSANSEKKQYDVFISYRRTTGANDARLLEQALKARGFKVFFDYNSIRDGKFDERIFAAIEEAPVFILIMSEGVLDQTGDSWVRTELEHALKLEKKIIPAAPSDQKWSFPARLPEPLVQLRFEQVSEINKGALFEVSVDIIIKERFPAATRNRILPKSQAAVLGVRTEKKKWSWPVFFITLTFLVLAAAGGVLYDTRRTVVNYYADYVDSYGLPQGIFPLTAKQVRKRNLHYRFEYRGYRFGKTIHADSSLRSPFRLLGFRRVLRRVVQAGSAGTPRKSEHSEYGDRPMIQKFHYDETGRLREKKYYRIGGKDGSGLVEKRLLFSNENDVVNGLIIFYREGSNRAMKFSGASVTLGDPEKQSEKSSIAMHDVTRDRFGHPLSLRFRNSSGTPARDADGIFGFKYLLDDWGRISELWYLDYAGKRQPNKLGVAGKKYFYRDRKMVRAEYVDASGKPTMNHLGWMVSVDEFDSDDNNITSSYYNAKGELTLHKDGYAKVKRTYDERGNLVEAAFLGVGNKPCFHKDGYAKVKRTYDDRGNVIEEVEEEYLGVDGKPCFHKDGYTKVRRKYDERGNLVEVAFLGVDNKPCFHKDGYAKVKRKFDDRGNVTKEEYFGVDNKPCFHKDGYAKVKRTYDDERENLVEVAFLGVDGKPCLNKNGVAKRTMKYDEQGNCTEQAFFDIGDKRCLNQMLFSKSTRNRRGNVIEEEFFGVDDRRCLNKNGFAKFTQKYDERGNVIEEEYFGVDGKSCLWKGIAKFRQKYDDRGNVIDEEFFGVDGKPCLHKDGFARRRMRYDERGNLVDEEYFGVDGKPCLNKDGFARITTKYDERDICIGRRGFLVGEIVPAGWLTPHRMPENL